MRREVERILPSIANVESLREFLESCNISNLELSLDNAPISDHNFVEVSKEVWE